ncbi:MAG: ABC transporter substrate-binding protein, partial [Jiangellaceae bacterium]
MSGAEVVRGLSWDHPRGRDPVLATSDAWHRAHPDVRLEWTPRSLADFAGGGLDGLVGAYDLVCIDHPVIGEAVERGWIVPLDDLVPHDVLERLTLGSVDGWSGAYRHDGRTYAVPVDAAALTAASRPDLLERNGLAAPGTFGELLDLARTSGRVAVPLSVFGTVALFASLCAQLGEELFAAGPGLVGAEVGHQALGLMTELAKAVPDQCFDDGAAQLLERLSGTDDLAYVGYAYGYSTYARAGGGRRRVTFAGAPPVVRGTSPRPTLGGVGLAVLRDAPQTEAAVTYARWVAADGLTIEVIEPLAPPFEQVKQGLPGRDQQLEQVNHLLRGMG